MATLAPARVEAMVLVSATPRFPEATHATIRAALLGFGAPPIEDAVELLRGIPHAALYVVPFGGHVPIFAKEREPFVRRALPFLDAVDQGA